MKTLLFIIVTLMLTVNLTAQIDVKKELPLTYANIAKKAAVEWPGDYTMQKYVIDQQCKSFNEYFDLRHTPPIPEDVFFDIEINALYDWCENNFGNCMKTFLTSDNPNETWETRWRKLDAMYACYGADWTMVVYVTKQQIEAYKALR